MSMADSWFKNIFTLAGIGAFAYLIYDEATNKPKVVNKVGSDVENQTEATYLPIAYGRCTLDGIRVSAETVNKYIQTTGNFDNSFYTPGITSTYVNSANNILVTQSVLCLGPINRVVDVLVDDKPITDPNFANLNGFRIDVHNAGSTSYSCELARSHVSNAAHSYFNKMAYATSVFKLNGTTPAFSGIPKLQFFLEGSKVNVYNATGQNPVLQYSNNPAWCLLHFLTNNYLTKSLVNINEIDIISFYKAAQICEQSTGISHAGKGRVWGSPDPYTYKRYECNMVLDTSRPARENISDILSTMNYADLVWSEGTYKLKLIDPTKNYSLAANLCSPLDSVSINDDHLVLGEQIDLAWPPISSKLNYITVKFKNEELDFKEDSISWPPKNTRTYYVGEGPYQYTADIYTKPEANSLAADYGVWAGSGSSCILVYLFKTPMYLTSTSATFYHSGPSSDSWNIKSESDASLALTTKPTTITLKANTVYKVTMNATGRGVGDRALAGTIQTSSQILWTTRDETFANYVTISETDQYSSLLAEDGGIILEQSTNLVGITSRTHALARARDILNKSRNELAVGISVATPGVLFEPGDIIQLDTATLDLAIQNFRIASIDIKDNDILQLKATLYDNAIIAPYTSTYQTEKLEWVSSTYVPAPTNVSYTVSTVSSSEKSSGTIKWSGVSSNLGNIVYRITVYGLNAPIIDVDKVLSFDVVGTTECVLPDLELKGITEARFSVKTVIDKHGESIESFTGTTLETLVPYDPSIIITPASGQPSNFTIASNSKVITPSYIILQANSGVSHSNYTWYINNVKQTYQIINGVSTPANTQTFRLIAPSDSNPLSIKVIAS